MVRVPKGWSDYQAAWIVDDDTLEDAPLAAEEEEENEEVSRGAAACTLSHSLALLIWR
jgi:hypothetical protein